MNKYFGQHENWREKLTIYETKKDPYCYVRLAELQELSKIVIHILPALNDFGNDKFNVILAYDIGEMQQLLLRCYINQMQMIAYSIGQSVWWTA